MKLSSYVCNAEGLYFLHLTFYPQIQAEFWRRLPAFSDNHRKIVYDILELNVPDWLVELRFWKQTNIDFYLGYRDLFRKAGVGIPFYIRGNEVGVML